MIAIVLLTFVILMAGCGGRATLDPGLDDLDRYDSEASAMAPTGAATEILESARRARAEAIPFVEKRDLDKAAPILERAVADARVAWALALAENKAREAERCRAAHARVRDLHATSRLLFVETAKAADQPLTGPEPALPEILDPLQALPPSLIEGGAPPPLSVADLRARTDALIEAAGPPPAVPVAAARNRFERAALEAVDEDRKSEKRAHALYLARRAAQEIEALARFHLAARVCADLSEPSADLADGNDLYLRRTVQMERDIKDKLQNEARSREDDMYQALALLEGKYAKIRREARGTIVSLPDILFDFNKATLKREVEFSLVRLATILDQFPEMSIAIEGHTDSIGTHEYNMELSERRARSVFDFLSSQGVAPERFTVAGLGMTRPVAGNETEEGRARNRRVDLVIREQE